MDVEPIYCAEQIRVPADLAHVLKAYTKEVIRQQPTNLVAFSAEYFAQLAGSGNTQHTKQPPSSSQLCQVYQALTLRGGASLPLEEMQEACSVAGISAQTVADVLAMGGIPSSAEVPVPEALLLLLAMGCDGVDAVLRGMFEVFGRHGQMDAGTAKRLLRFLGTKDHDNITEQVLEEVFQELDSAPVISLEGLMRIPSLLAKLRAPL